MQTPPDFPESATHLTLVEQDAKVVSMLKHPASVSVLEKIDYIYDSIQKLNAIVEQITPAQIQQVNKLASSPLGALFGNLLGR